MTDSGICHDVQPAMMCKDIAEFLRLLGTVYDAATDVGRWQDVAAAMTKYFNAEHCQIWVWNTDDHQMLLNMVHREGGGVDWDLLRRYEAIMKDPSASPAVRLIWDRTNQLNHLHDMVGAEIHRTSRLYREVHHPAGIEWVLWCEMTNADGDKSAVGVALLRGPDKPDFSFEERVLFAEVLGHIRRANAILRRLGQAEQRAGAAFALFDTRPVGILFASFSGRVVHANTGAETPHRRRSAPWSRMTLAYVD